MHMVAFFTLYISGKYDETSSIIELIKVIMISAVLLLLYIVVTFLIVKLEDYKKLIEWLIVTTMIMVVTAIISLAGVREGIGSVKSLVIYFQLALATFISFIILSATYLSKYKQVGLIQKALLKISNNWLFLIFIAIALVMMIIKLPYAVRGDAAFNYFVATDKTAIYMSSFEGMTSSSHSCFSYTVSIFVLAFIVKDTLLACHLMNIMWYIMGSIAFYKLLKKLFPDECNNDCALLSLIYMYAPIVLGLSDNLSWDYWTMFEISLLAYLSYCRYYILSSFLGIYMVYTKEPMIIVYGFFVLGNCIVDIIKKQNIFIKPRYYFDLTIASVWYFVYQNVHWYAADSFGLNWSYIVSKIKYYSVFNYNWIIYILAIVGIIRIIVKQDKHLIAFLIPNLLAFFSFVVFSCAFQTVQNPRYIDVAAFLPAFLAAVSILDLKNAKLRRCVASILVLLLLYSNYHTVDPLTLCLYPNINIGNEVMVSIDPNPDKFFNEYMTYNSQHVDFEKALDKAIESAGEDVYNSLHIFPEPLSNTCFFDGLGVFNIFDNGYVLSDENWDESQQVRTINKEIEYKSIKVCNLSDITLIPKIDVEGYDKLFFYYAPFTGVDMAEYLTTNYDTRLTQYEVGGFIIYRLEIEI